MPMAQPVQPTNSLQPHTPVLSFHTYTYARCLKTVNKQTPREGCPKCPKAQAKLKAYDTSTLNHHHLKARASLVILVLSKILTQPDTFTPTPIPCVSALLLLISILFLDFSFLRLLQSLSDTIDKSWTKSLPIQLA